MDFLARFPKLSNQLAALVIFLAWYLAATITTVIMLNLQERIGMLFMTFVAVLAFMTIVFGIAWRIHRTDLVDMAWGPAFVVAAIASLASSGHDISYGL